MQPPSTPCAALQRRAGRGRPCGRSGAAGRPGRARARSPHYKALVKALVRAALGPVDVQTAKDVETCLAGVRSDKVKEEAAAKLAKKGAPPPLYAAGAFISNLLSLFTNISTPLRFQAGARLP